jgi:hypothetical protein
MIFYSKTLSNLSFSKNKRLFHIITRVLSLFSLLYVKGIQSIICEKFGVIDQFQILA